MRERLFDLAMGLHSRIPLCCVIAFMRGEYPEKWPEGTGYRPCGRCAREILSGGRQPATVHQCDKHAKRCRFFLRWNLRAVHRDVRACDSCGERADVVRLGDPGEGWSIRSCVLCDREPYWHEEAAA